MVNSIQITKLEKVIEVNKPHISIVIGLFNFAHIHISSYCAVENAIAISNFFPSIIPIFLLVLIQQKSD